MWSAPEIFGLATWAGFRINGHVLSHRPYSGSVNDPPGLQLNRRIFVGACRWHSSCRPRTIAESDRTVRDASHTAVVPADINGEHREFTVTTAHRCGHAARASGIVRDEATPPALPDQPREPARILIVHDHAAVPHERRTAGIEAGQRLAGVCGLRLGGAQISS